MKVRDLIEFLEDKDPDLDVGVCDSGGTCWNFSIWEADPEDVEAGTHHIIIDPDD